MSCLLDARLRELTQGKRDVQVVSACDSVDPIQHIKLLWGSLGVVHAGCAGSEDSSRILYSNPAAPDRVMFSPTWKPHATPNFVLVGFAPCGQLRQILAVLDSAEPKSICLLFFGPKVLSREAVEKELQKLEKYQQFFLRSVAYQDCGIPAVGGGWVAALRLKPVEVDSSLRQAVDRTIDSLQEFFAASRVRLEEVVQKKKSDMVTGEFLIWQKRAAEKRKKDGDHPEKEEGPVKEDFPTGHVHVSFHFVCYSHVPCSLPLLRLC